jgi:RES domain-containing protein
VVYQPSLLDELESRGGRPFERVVWRHMFSGLHPARANTRGARWNPPGVAAIYTSTDRDTAVAEAEYAIASQPVRPRASRQLYQVHVSLGNMIDLSDRIVLERVGVAEAELGATNEEACRTVGGAAHWLGYDGLLVPSARRREGTNLVLFADRLDVDAAFEVVDRQDLE